MRVVGGMADAPRMCPPDPTDVAPHLQSPDANPLTAWFLGPRAENAVAWSELFEHVFTDYVHWRRNYFPADPWIVGRVKRRSPEHEAWYDWLTSHLDVILSELKFHFPLHSPRYNAHMVSEQSLPAILGYFAGLLYNPNNVSGEAAPITIALELEVGRMISTMLGYNPRRSWAHLCSGGTLATLEALWVARGVQFAPFIAREYCRTHGIPFTVRTASGVEQPITGIADAELIALRPHEAGTVLRALASHLADTDGRPAAEVRTALDAAVAASPFNVARRGLAPILTKLGLRPVVLASATAHYSIAKACNLLGYGEDALRLVPVNQRFQMDVDALRSMMLGLQPDEYIAGVVGIVGSTEEGAVDPIHRIRFLRDECERERNRSFWLHVDAAWGGYLRCLFTGLAVPHLPHGAGLDALCDAYIRALDMTAPLTVDAGAAHPEIHTLDVRWGERETFAALLAMPDGDSTTIDPHKMGYVPYPAGIVAFRQGEVMELVTQRAQYLSDGGEGIGSFGEREITALGPHILEGSKPGAAALACWLAHRTIPLTADGHGRIVRSSLLSARKLWRLLGFHARLFRRLERERCPEGPGAPPFTFIPITEPETNLVCFVARPMAWRDGAMELSPVTLTALNALNRAVYDAASIPGSRSHHRPSATQPFFVSRTRFEEQQYRGASLRQLLDRLDVTERDYAREGLFVLRSTVMNPWHAEAEAAGMDYLFEFVRFLHRVTAEALG